MTSASPTVPHGLIEIRGGNPRLPVARHSLRLSPFSVLAYFAFRHQRFDLLHQDGRTKRFAPASCDYVALNPDS